MEASIFCLWRYRSLFICYIIITRCLLFRSFFQVQVIKKLIDCEVKEHQIVVLSPYRAQCHIIGEDLAKQQLSEIPVMSIVKSQGRMKCIKRIVIKAACCIDGSGQESIKAWGNKHTYLSQRKELNAKEQQDTRGQTMSHSQRPNPKQIQPWWQEGHVYLCDR